MDQRTFNRVTKEVFLQYGFCKEERNRYVLRVDEEINVVVDFASWRGIKYFDYFFEIPKLHDPSIPRKEWVGVALGDKLEYREDLRGYQNHEILIEEWTEEEWREKLNYMLHKYFDSFKEDAIKHIRSHVFLMSVAYEEYIEKLYLSRQKQKEIDNT